MSVRDWDGRTPSRSHDVEIGIASLDQGHSLATTNDGRPHLIGFGGHLPGQAHGSLHQRSESFLILERQ